MSLFFSQLDPKSFGNFGNSTNFPLFPTRIPPESPQAQPQPQREPVFLGEEVAQLLHKVFFSKTRVSSWQVQPLVNFWKQCKQLNRNKYRQLKKSIALQTAQNEIPSRIQEKSMFERILQFYEKDLRFTIEQVAYKKREQKVIQKRKKEQVAAKLRKEIQELNKSQRKVDLQQSVNRLYSTGVFKERPSTVEPPFIQFSKSLINEYRTKHPKQEDYLQVQRLLQFFKRMAKVGILEISCQKAEQNLKQTMCHCVSMLVNRYYSVTKLVSTDPETLTQVYNSSYGAKLPIVFPTNRSLLQAIEYFVTRNNKRLLEIERKKQRSVINERRQGKSTRIAKQQVNVLEQFVKRMVRDVQGRIQKSKKRRDGQKVQSKKVRRQVNWDRLLKLSANRPRPKSSDPKKDKK